MLKDRRVVLPCIDQAGWGQQQQKTTIGGQFYEPDAVIEGLTGDSKGEGSQVVATIASLVPF